MMRRSKVPNCVAEAGKIWMCIFHGVNNSHNKYIYINTRIHLYVYICMYVTQSISICIYIIISRYLIHMKSMYDPDVIGDIPYSIHIPQYFVHVGQHLQFLGSKSREEADNHQRITRYQYISVTDRINACVCMYIYIYKGNERYCRNLTVFSMITMITQQSIYIFPDRL